MAREPVIRYKGKGEFHNGIPARNLSADEYAALDTEQRAVVRESGIYDYPAFYADTHPKASAKAAPSPPKPAAKPAVPTKLIDTLHPAIDNKQPPTQVDTSVPAQGAPKDGMKQ